MFLFLDDIIAVYLSWIILNEWMILTNGMKMGFVMMALVIIRIIIGKIREMLDKKVRIFAYVPPIFFVYVFGYSVIWGLMSFLMKYMAVADVPLPTFMLGWYGGALITVSVMTFANANYKEREDFLLKGRRDLRMMFISSLFIMANTWFSYWSFQLAPLTVVQPVFFAEQMIIPTLIGFLCFKEVKGFRWGEWLSFVIAIIGAILVIVNYR